MSGRPRRAPARQGPCLGPLAAALLWLAIFPLLSGGAVGGMAVLGATTASDATGTLHGSPGASFGPSMASSSAIPLDAGRSTSLTGSSTNATQNLSSVLNRAVVLVSIAAAGVITLVWSRVALSWFSHDPSKKVQAKERARDALVGSAILLAAVSGLAWGLASWVLTGV